MPREFYRRDTLEVAPALLGKLLLVATEGDPEPSVGRIVETEAYQGNDPASHSARGETPRTTVMFGEPGIAYVYFIYGMYEMLNFVTEPRGSPGAVLIRAIEPVAGLDSMRKRRNAGKILRGDRPELTNGPGKLSRALGIRRSHNGQSLTGPVLFVLDEGSRIPRSEIWVSPRVGISAGRDRLWRFFMHRSRFVSRAPQNALSQPFLPAPRK